ncbi:MAG: hypothetical protein AAGG75_26690, partial [Bacteroidota bacterium]
LFQLIIYLEKGNYLYIDNAFKSFNYHLKKQGKDQDFEGKVTYFLKQISSHKESKKKIYTAFWNDLEQFHSHKIPGYEEISIWVESKLKNTTFLRVMENRYLQK